MSRNNKNISYLPAYDAEMKWGLSVTTAGYQKIEDGKNYPAAVQHPSLYRFRRETGRILPEYQLIYIPEGSGWFESDSCNRVQIVAGSIFLVFPDEWHNYWPDDEGWSECWIGFKGAVMESWVKNGFFTPAQPIVQIGTTQKIIGLFHDAADYAQKELPGYQELISSIVLHLLGEIYYARRNGTKQEAQSVQKIKDALEIMKEEYASLTDTEQIAERIHVSYSWFRTHFKAYTGSSPKQYLLELKYLKARELLFMNTMSVKEIAFALNFSSTANFSTFFSQREGISPKTFQKKYFSGHR